MSLYEALVLVAIAGAGGFAWYLYRSDTKPGALRPPTSGPGTPMFGRDKGKR
jgi:hypothetical protein